MITWATVWMMVCIGKMGGHVKNGEVLWFVAVLADIACAWLLGRAL